MTCYPHEPYSPGYPSRRTSFRNRPPTPFRLHSPRMGDFSPSLPSSWWPYSPGVEPKINNSFIPPLSGWGCSDRPDNSFSPPSYSPFGHDITPSTTQSRKFYFDDGNVIFHVANVTYKIHRYHFETNSSMLASEISLAGRGSSSAHGHPHPHVIWGFDVMPEDFELLLSLFYPPEIGKCAIPDTSVEGWTTILKLAHRFEMKDVYKLAMDKLSRCDPARSWV